MAYYTTAATPIPTTVLYLAINMIDHIAELTWSINQSNSGLVTVISCYIYGILYWSRVHKWYDAMSSVA